MITWILLQIKKKLIFSYTYMVNCTLYEIEVYPGLRLGQVSLEHSETCFSILTVTNLKNTISLARLLVMPRKKLPPVAQASFFRFFFVQIC